MVSANWSTYVTGPSKGRFSTLRVRMRLSEVWPIWSEPRIQHQPGQHPDDIAARFGEPSAFKGLMHRCGCSGIEDGRLDRFAHAKTISESRVPCYPHLAVKQKVLWLQPVSLAAPGGSLRGSTRARNYPE